MPSVVLDPGHGVETAGKRSPDSSFLEYEFNLDVALRLKAILERYGIEVVLTHSDGHDISLADKVAIANKYGADIFISIHADASGDDWSNANGYTVYTYINVDNNTQRLAECVDNALTQVGLRNRGIKQADFYVIRKTSMSAILIEHGFYTNQIEVEKLKDSAFRQMLAEADAKGVLQYFGIEYKEEDDKLERIVLYLGDADIFPAVPVSQEMHCPLMKKEDFDNQGLKVSEIIQIGGKPGSDRKSTVKDAANLL